MLQGRLLNLFPQRNIAVLCPQQAPYSLGDANVHALAMLR